MSPDIARALKLFGFDITHVQFVPEWQEKNQREGVKDLQIIEWCRNNKAVWITHDKKAKRQWSPDIKAARIDVLWIRGRSEGFNSWAQFKIVMRVIDEIQVMLRSAHGALHFRAGVGGGVRPKVDWAESSQDMPRTHAP